MRKTLSASLVLLFIHLCLPISSSDAFDFPVQMYNFHIINNLPNNSAALRVECHSSGEVDVGSKLLYMYEDFQWQFFLFSWQTTGYFCDFWWLEKTKNNVLVFHHDLAFRYCSTTGFLSVVNECRWYVREDGFYIGDGSDSHNVEVLNFRLPIGLEEHICLWVGTLESMKLTVIEPHQDILSTLFAPIFVRPK